MKRRKEGAIEPGALVVAHLVRPTEKFWGILERLDAVGVTLRGVRIDSFDEWLSEIASGEATGVGLATMFVPMERVERVFLDESQGELESYADRFARRTGHAHPGLVRKKTVRTGRGRRTSG